MSASLRRRWRRPQCEALEPRHLLAAEPIISEFLASNRNTLDDGNDQSSDWIELFNAGDEPVNLQNWTLTDDVQELDKWTFPSTLLEPGDYLLVFASGNDEVDLDGNLHTNFSLNADGEYVALVNPAHVVVSEYGTNGSDYPQQFSDISHGISQQFNDTLLVDTGSIARVLVPTAANGGDGLGDAWKGGHEPFDDAAAAGWITESEPGVTATTGIGFGDLGPPVEIAAELLVSLDAGDLSAGTGLWTNAGSLGDFVEHGDPIRATIGGAQAVSFDGIDDWYEGPVTSPGLVGIGATRSIEVWAYNPSVGDVDTMVSWSHRGGPDGSLVSFNFGTSASDGAVTHWGSTNVGWDNVPTAGEWHHLAYTFDGTTTRLYDNGQLLQTVAHGPISTHAGDPIQIAAQRDDTGSASFLGSLFVGRVRIHDGVLAESQVNQNFLAERSDFIKPPPPGDEIDPPIHRYSFADGDTTAIDSIGAAHGTFEGGAAVAAGAIQLDGTDDYVDLPAATIGVSALTATTFEAWATFAEETGGNSRLFDFGEINASDFGANYLFFSPNGFSDSRAGITNTDPGILGEEVASAGQLNDRAQVHIVVIVDDANDEMRLYIDGALASQIGMSNTLAGVGTEAAFLGRSLYSIFPYLQGAIDEFRIYDYALSDGQVIGNFQAGPNVLNLVAAGAPGDEDDTPPVPQAADIGSTDAVETNIEQAMLGVNASAFVRIPFTVADPTSFDTLVLNMQYDDGFVAYLNGFEVARRHAPGEVGSAPAFDATATAVREELDEILVERINLTTRLDLLQAGQNMLAIHGLNATAADDDFLVLPQLIGTQFSLSDPEFFDPPTPGEPNGGGISGFVADTRFDRDRGFYAEPFELTISTATPGATIAYTTDGTIPTLVNGTVVPPVDDETPGTAVINIDRTTTLRAAAFKNDFGSTNVDTQTYIFLDDVINQTRTNVLARGFPASWGSNVVDYDVDPDIATNTNSAFYEPNLKDDLLTIPSLSLVIPNDDFFGAQNGIYANATRRGVEWERAVSVELIDPNDRDNTFQVDAGIRASGGVGRSTGTARHSMRLLFKEIYGPTKLDYPLFADTDVATFNGIYLRGGWNYTYTGDSGGNTQRAQYLRDQFARDTVRDMGRLAPHGQHMHLYINGLYWGIYNIHERPDSTFGAQYLGGTDEDFDVLKTPAEQFGNVQMEINAGDRIAWDQMFALAQNDLSDPDNYAALTELVDVPALIDYMLMVFYVGSRDAPVLLNNNVEPRNFWALRKREAGGGYHFIPWDVEWSLEDPNVNRVNITGRENPHVLFQRLGANPEFRQLVADHIQQHFFNDGALTPAAATERYLTRADAIDRAIVGESARWGDTLRGTPYTRDNEWLAEQNRLVNQYFSVRTDIVLRQLRDAGWFPDNPGPLFELNGVTQQGGPANAGDTITTIVPAGQVFNDTALVAAAAEVTLLVPTDDSLGTSWTAIDFDDGAWFAGSTGVGYENGAGYDDLLDPAVDAFLQAEQFNQQQSVFIRAAFEFDSGQELDRLVLRMKYDDGFVAYLNGTEVARSGTVAAGPVTIDSFTGNHPDSQAIVFEDFDISDFANLLQEGGNVLAIHGLNQAANSSDMLILPELVSRSLDNITVSVPVYTTTDGTDPRLPDGTISPDARVTGTTSTTLVAQDDGVQVLVPSTQNGGNLLGTTWTGSPANEPFDTTGWSEGTGPVGFDTGTAPSTIEIAGALYVDLDARDASAGASTWVNDGALGDFQRMGAPVLAAFGNTNQPGVNFRAAADYFLGPSAVADLEANSTRSIEIWAFNPTVGEQNGEESMVAWGRRGGPNGTNMAFNYGSHPLWGAVTHWGGNGPDMPWDGGLPVTGEWHHLVYTYDGSGTARVYADGQLNYTENVGSLNTHAGFPIVLAAQNTTTGRDFGQAYLGALGLVRVHGGTLTAAQIMNNFQVDAGRYGKSVAGYDALVRTDVEAEMFGQSASLFMRMPFPVAAGATFDELRLKVRYDDGFVAYLNGGEVARRNAPQNVAWNSAATAERPDSSAVLFETIDISSHVGDLLSGQTNILALQGLNQQADDGDFLLSAELEGLAQLGSTLTLTETTELNARWLADGVWGPLSSATFVISPPPNITGIVITEINYNPAAPSAAEQAAIADIDNDDFEFIEVFNAHPADSINLLGMQLVDGVDFTFPSISLAPGEYAVVVEDRLAFEQRYGTTAAILGEWSGGLSNGGERVTLQNALVETIVSVEYDDAEPWPERADRAGGTLELVDPFATPIDEYDKYYRWRGSSAFHGTPGSAGADAPGVVINEVLAHTDPPVTHSDSIELLNASTETIDISGWFLSDSQNDLLKFAIPAGTVLAPGAYVVFDESDFNPTPLTPGPDDFALSGASGDDVWLVFAVGDAVQTFVDDVHFGASLNGESLGRVPNETGRLAPLGRTSLGCSNGHPRVGPLVIAEVNYQPAAPSAEALAVYPSLTRDDLEFVEITNPTVTPVDLTGWRLRGGVDYDFEDGLVFGVESLVIVPFNPADPQNADRLEAFKIHYGTPAGVKILGGYQGRLSDDGERITLQRPDDPPQDEPLLTPRVIEDEFVYDNRSPWPTAAAGGGMSLQRRAPVFFANDAQSWRVAPPSPGNDDFVGNISGDYTGDNVVDANDIDVLADALNRDTQVFYYTLLGTNEPSFGDFQRLVTEVLGTAFGDANLDGAVDGSDFNLWNDHKFQSCYVSWSTGDFNGDTVVDGSDFNLWFENRFQPAAAAADRPRKHSVRAPRAALTVDHVPALAIDAALAVASPSYPSTNQNGQSSWETTTRLANENFESEEVHEVDALRFQRIRTPSSRRDSIGERAGITTEQDAMEFKMLEEIFARWP